MESAMGDRRGSWYDDLARVTAAGVLLRVALNWMVFVALAAVRTLCSATIVPADAECETGGE